MNANETNVVEQPTEPTPTAATPAKVKKEKAAPKKAAKPAKKSKAKGDGTAPKGPKALREYAPNYVHDGEHKTAAGNPSIHCGDEVAKKLLGKSIDDCYKIAAKVTEESEADLRKRYGHLNLGMQRMNLGNKMRGVLNAK